MITYDIVDTNQKRLTVPKIVLVNATYVVYVNIAVNCIIYVIALSRIRMTAVYFFGVCYNKVIISINEVITYN